MSVTKENSYHKSSKVANRGNKNPTPCSHSIALSRTTPPQAGRNVNLPFKDWPESAVDYACVCLPGDSAETRTIELEQFRNQR